MCVGLAWVLYNKSCCAETDKFFVCVQVLTVLRMRTQSYPHSKGATTNTIPGFQDYRVQSTGFQQLSSTQTCREQGNTVNII